MLLYNVHILHLCYHTYPALQLITEVIFTCVLSFVIFLNDITWLALIDFPDGCHETSTTATLTLITVWMTEALMITNKIGGVGQLNNNLKC